MIAAYLSLVKNGESFEANHGGYLNNGNFREIDLQSGKMVNGIMRISHQSVDSKTL